MARVNFETRAIAEGRFKDFQDDCGFSRMEAVGCLVLFWHDSQERLVARATKDTLLKFIPTPREKRESVFEALLRNDYISVIPRSEKFLIHGNAKHVSAHAKRKVSGAKGGINSGATRRKKSIKIKDIEARTSNIEAPVEPNSIQFNSIQFNSEQFNSDQISSVQRSSSQEEKERGDAPVQAPVPTQELFALENTHADPKPPKRAPNAVYAVWEAYRHAFHEHYGFDPPGGDRAQLPATLGKLKAVLTKIPAEAAPQVAEFYLSHRDAFYVRSNHAIGPFIAQAESLYTQWKTGAPMLTSQARDVERREHTGTAFDRAFENLDLMGVRFAGT